MITHSELSAPQACDYCATSYDWPPKATCTHIQQGAKPHRHNTIPESWGVIRRRKKWRCVMCHEVFDERPDPTPDWVQQCDLDREEAIKFEQDVLRASKDWDERDVAWTEDEQRGPLAWVGCLNIHVISEEP